MEPTYIILIVIVVGIGVCYYFLSGVSGEETEEHETQMEKNETKTE